MQEKINKYMWVFIVVIVVIIMIFIFLDKKKENFYDKKFYYMDTYIYVKLFTSDEKKANEAMDEIDNIYSTYHKLSDRFNGYDGVNNIYYIHNNESDEEYIELDERLYSMLEFGYDWYQKSDGLFDISLGNVIDVWKVYRETGIGIPTESELQNANTQSINDVVLKDSKILNNHVNIDLGGIAKGYATNEVGKYLESIGINKYLVNAGGNVLVGNGYNNDAYKIGIEDPTSNNYDIFIKIKAINKAVVTSGSYERFYEYEGTRYSHIINPKTLFPSDYALSVTVICDDSSLADILSTTLFLMPVQDGVNYINSMDGVEAIWYLSNDEQIMSDGFKEYIYE